jgi:hypothetical protein
MRLQLARRATSSERADAAASPLWHPKPPRGTWELADGTAASKFQRRHEAFRVGRKLLLLLVRTVVGEIATTSVKLLPHGQK